MKKLLYLADDYIAQCDWKDLALIKFCLCAVGVMIGLVVPQKIKKSAGLAAAAVFVVTYIPLMIGFVASALGYGNDECDVFLQGEE